MPVSHRGCTTSFALLLQVTLLLQLLVGAEVSEKLQLDGLRQNATVHLAADATHADQLEDETVLLQKFVSVTGRHNARMVGQQDTAAVEHTGSDAFIPAQSPFNTLLRNEIMFEVSQRRTGVPMQSKSKLVLALLEAFFFPAFCGVDRCYMGQPLIGVAKGLTLGGLFVWYMADFVIIIINIFQQKDTIDMFGFEAYFGSSQLTSALLVAIICAVAQCCIGSGCAMGGVHRLRADPVIVEGTDEHLTVEKHNTVHCNYKTISGTEAVIIGDHNHIEGGWHQIVGDCNIVEGKGCYIKGNANLVNGISNQVEGRGNDVNGMSNVVSGAHNKVAGANPRCTETEPFKQSIFDDYQAKRSLGRRENPGSGPEPLFFNSLKAEQESLKKPPAAQLLEPHEL